MQSRDPVRATRRLIVDFLRAHRPNGVSARVLVELGALFGVTPAAVRSAVSRLIREEKLEVDSHGAHRLASALDGCSDHIDGWRLGEQRRRPWRGDWITLEVDLAARERSVRPLGLFGFFPSEGKTYVRPNNLALTETQLVTRLDAFGVVLAQAPTVRGDLDEETCCRVRRAWDTDALRAGYRAQLRATTQSAARVEELDLTDALVETFIVGSRSIRVLATDPLLPDEMLPSQDRAVLHRAMIAYDIIARRLWHQWIDDVEARRTPVRAPALEIGLPG